MDKKLPIDKLEKFAIELNIFYNILMVAVDNKGNEIDFENRLLSSKKIPDCCRMTINNITKSFDTDINALRRNTDYLCSCGSRIVKIPLTKNDFVYMQTFSIIPSNDISKSFNKNSQVDDIHVAKILIQNRIDIITDYYFAQEQILDISKRTSKLYEGVHTLHFDESDQTPTNTNTGIAKRFCESLNNIISANCIAIITESTMNFSIVHCRGDYCEENHHLLEELSKLLLILNKENEDIVIINDIYKETHFSEKNERFYKMTFIPLNFFNGSRRWVYIYRGIDDEDFSEIDYTILHLLVKELDMFIENRHIQKNMSDFLFNTARTCILMIEGKDIYTRGHSERVCMMSMYLGKLLNLDKLDYFTLRWASLFHDIGKLNIPEDILKNPDVLSDDDYEKMKGHVTYGAWLLSYIKKFKNVAEAARHHHENYDGSGYPDNLIGEKIPLCSRIIAVADTFDALTSTRCYRDAFNPEVAIRMMQDQRGVKLDPMITELFIENCECFITKLGDAGDWLNQSQSAFNWLSL